MKDIGYAKREDTPDDISSDENMDSNLGIGGTFFCGCNVINIHLKALMIISYLETCLKEFRNSTSPSRSHRYYMSNILNSRKNRK